VQAARVSPVTLPVIDIGGLSRSPRAGSNLSAVVIRESG
jgi:hypothetical protein